MARPKPNNLIKLEKVPAILINLTGVTRTHATIYNWIRKGRINAHGQMTKLAGYKRLGQIYTTEEAVIKFLRELG